MKETTKERLFNVGKAVIYGAFAYEGSRLVKFSLKDYHPELLNKTNSTLSSFDNILVYNRIPDNQDLGKIASKLDDLNETLDSTRLEGYANQLKTLSLTYDSSKTNQQEHVRAIILDTHDQIKRDYRKERDHDIDGSIVLFVIGASMLGILGYNAIKSAYRSIIPKKKEEPK